MSIRIQSSILRLIQFFSSTIIIQFRLIKFEPLLFNQPQILVTKKRRDKLKGMLSFPEMKPSKIILFFFFTFAQNDGCGDLVPKL